MSKQILFIKETELNRAKDLAKETVNKLNQYIEETEKKFKIKFTENEKLELLNNGSKFINELLESRFMFPKATAEFNKNALGIDTDELLKNYNIFSSRYKAYDYKFNESGKFILEDEQPKYDECIKYLENDTQKEAIALSEKICKHINEAVSLGHIESRKLFHMRDFGQLFDVKSDALQKVNELVPNLYRISYMK